MVVDGRRGRGRGHGPFAEPGRPQPASAAQLTARQRLLAVGRALAAGSRPGRPRRSAAGRQGSYGIQVGSGGQLSACAVETIHHAVQARSGTWALESRRSSACDRRATWRDGRVDAPAGSRSAVSKSRGSRAFRQRRQPVVRGALATPAGRPTGAERLRQIGAFQPS